MTTKELEEHVIDALMRDNWDLKEATTNRTYLQKRDEIIIVYLHGNTVKVVKEKKEKKDDS